MKNEAAQNGVQNVLTTVTKTLDVPYVLIKRTNNVGVCGTF